MPSNIDWEALSKQAALCIFIGASIAIIVRYFINKSLAESKKQFNEDKKQVTNKITGNK